ncbi:hypothetical protein N2152v2_007738 [Parachlorella kessleri]
MAIPMHNTAGARELVFEPEYLALFSHLLSTHPPGGEGACFLHLLDPASAPPALLEEDSVGGLPRLGCCAEVKAIRQLAGGRLEVEYAGTRRARVMMLHQEHPFMVAAAEWVDDWGISEAETPLEDLERQLMGTLQQVSRLTALLRPPGAPLQLLPEAVQRYSPPAPQRLTSYDALVAARHPAATAIDMWRRQGSVYDKPSRQEQHQRARASDPYQGVREQLGKQRRRELFSFAAAQMLELGLPQRLALLLTQDTGARLQYVLAAVRPHLQELAARAALKAATEEAGL